MKKLSTSALLSQTRNLDLEYIFSVLLFLGARLSGTCTNKSKHRNQQTYLFAQDLLLTNSSITFNSTWCAIFTGKISKKILFLFGFKTKQSNITVLIPLQWFQESPRSSDYVNSPLICNANQGSLEGVTIFQFILTGELFFSGEVLLGESQFDGG